jgi:hypothetical protein
MRGKYRLVKIEPEKKFSCVIGKSKFSIFICRNFDLLCLGLDLKFHGPFHCLNHKVDLTRDEAENTLFQRREQLEQYIFIFFLPHIDFLLFLKITARSKCSKYCQRISCSQTNTNCSFTRLSQWRWTYKTR